MNRRKALKTLGRGILAGSMLSVPSLTILDGCKERKPQNLETRVVVESFSCIHPITPCFGPDNKVYYSANGGKADTIFDELRDFFASLTGRSVVSTTYYYDSARIFSAPIEGKTIHKGDYRENEGRIVIDLVKDHVKITTMYVAPCGIHLGCVGKGLYFFDTQGNLLKEIDGDFMPLFDSEDRKLKEEEHYPWFIYDGDEKGYYTLGYPREYFIPFDGSKMVLLKSAPEKIKQREKAREILNNNTLNIRVDFASQVRATKEGDIQVLYIEEASGIFSYRCNLKLMTIKKDYFAGREEDYEKIMAAYRDLEGEK